MSNENNFEVDIPDFSGPTVAPKSPVTPAPQQSGAVDLPDLQLAEKKDGPQIIVEPDAKAVAVKFGIIGSGQAGSRLCDSFFQLGYRRVCAINTTAQDFLGLQLPAKNQLVISSAGGAGKDLRKGEEALRGASEEVINLMRQSFGDDIEHIIICAGAGGGTGSGSALGLVRLAKYYFRQLGKPENVGMMVTLPKYSEGGAVQANAYEVVSRISEMAAKKEISPVIVADNQSIHQMFPDVAVKHFWSTANKNTVGLVDIFNVLAAQQSQYTTFDRQDYRSMLGSGVIVFGATKLTSYTKDTDISDGLRGNLKKSLLVNDFVLEEASHVAGILAAPDEILGLLPQANIDLAFQTLERILGGEGKKLVVHQGVYEATKMALCLYTMIGGLTIPQKRLDIMKARAGI